MLYDSFYVVYDIETGGLSPDKNPIVEIACVVLDYQMNEVDRYESLIKPYDKNLTITPGALQANGLSMEEISQGEDSKVVCKELVDLFKKYKVGRYKKPIFVGHNISKFDNPFMEAFFKFHKEDLWKYIEKYCFDTLFMARLTWGNDDEMPDHKLGACCTRAGIELVNAHRAMNDVVSNVELFKFFTNKSRGKSVGEVKETRFRETFKF